MTSGSLDDVLGSARELQELINGELAEYLGWAWKLIPVRNFFIPYGAGISFDGRRVYISHDIQTIVRGVDCFSALVRHETTEWGLRQYLDIGEDYLDDPTGHRLANRAEADRVNELLDDPGGWELYSSIIDPQVANSERGKIEELPIPLDLALYPYDDEMQGRLFRGMINQRSKEEWNRLNNEPPSN